MGFRSNQAAALRVVIGVLLASQGCRDGTVDQSDLRPTRTNAVVAIHFADAGQSEVEVRLRDSPTPYWSWYPGRFPARISAPFGTRVVVLAQRDGFDLFREEQLLTRDRPEIVLNIVLNETREVFDVPSSEIPRETGVQTIHPPRIGHPSSTRFAIEQGEGNRWEPGFPLVDDDARVWRVTDSGDYLLVATVDPIVIERMKRHCRSAVGTEMVAEATVLYDATWQFRALCTLPGAFPIELAVQGRDRIRRRNPSANALLGWLLGVRRDAWKPETH